MCEGGMLSARWEELVGGEQGDEGGVGDRGQNVRGSPIKPSGRERAAHGGSSWRWRRIIICVTLEKLLKFSAPQCPHLFNGDNKSDSDYHVSNLPCVKALTSVRSSSSSQPPAQVRTIVSAR